MPPDAADILLALGRILLGGFFAFAGARHFFILPGLTAAMAARGIPFPRLAVMAGSTFELVAGLSLAAGLFVAPAALGLVLFTVLASVLLVNFWHLSGHEREAMKIVFLSNVAIMGGLLVAAAT